jgi:hypothetical protein
MQLLIVLHQLFQILWYIGNKRLGLIKVILFIVQHFHVLCFQDISGISLDISFWGR